MERLTIAVNVPLGFHARPVSRWVSLAQTFQSHITVTFRDKTVDGKSALGLMALAVPGGAELEVCASGPDEHEALAALAGLASRSFST